MGNENYKEDKEYEKLRREYRNMEVNRKTLAEENQNVLRRQHQSLKKLRAENENLKTDVATIQARTTMKPLNQFEQSQLDNVTQEIQRYTSLNEAERNEVSTMKDNISNLKDELWHRHRKMGGSNAAIENYQNIERQTKTLESKVDQATFKLNQTLAANRSLREDIDSLREERISFEGVYKKVEKQLQDCKEQMAQIIEKSNFAYEQRDKARMEILAIDQSTKKEQESFDMQMEEMGQKLEEEIKAAAERRKLQHPNDFDSTEEDQAKLIAEQAGAKEQMLIEEKEVAAKERGERIIQFEDTLKEIEAVTGISAVEDLVKMWKENEEHNYSLFKFANQQQNEAEDLKEELNSFQLHQQDGIMSGDESPMYPKETMDHLNRNITMNTKRMTSLDLKLNECDNLLGIMKDGVKMLMLRLDCKVTNEISDLNVSEANILDYMALIEEKATSILKEYHSLVVEELKPPMKGQDTGEKVEDIKDSGSCTSREHKNRSSREYQQVRDLQLLTSGQDDHQNRKSCLNPPKLLVEYYSGDEQCSDTDGDNARPLYGDELKERTLHRMSYCSQEEHDDTTTKKRSSEQEPAPPPMISMRSRRRRGSSLTFKSS